MKEKAQDLGRLLGQSDEYKALGRARDRLTQAGAAVATMNRLDALEREISTALHSGEEPSDTAKQEYETVFGTLHQVHAVDRGGPDEHARERQQGENGTEQDPVETRQAVHEPSRGVREGGRIAPSSAKVGNPAGGTVPGIAASAGRTTPPLTPYNASQIARTASPEVPEPVPPWLIIITTT
jgi:hypothetical protein